MVTALGCLFHFTPYYFDPPLRLLSVQTMTSAPPLKIVDFHFFLLYRFGSCDISPCFLLQYTTTRKIAKIAGSLGASSMVAFLDKVRDDMDCLVVVIKYGVYSVIVGTKIW